MKTPDAGPSKSSASGPRILRGLAVGGGFATVFLLLAAAEARLGWVEPAFDAMAHLFYEVPMLARVRHPTQVPLTRGHLAVLACTLTALGGAWPWLSRHARRFGLIILVGYTIRAALWIAGGNVPLVPGDSCHYLEVASSVARGEGPVKHYVESFFRDYPAIREGRGVLDDWATPLHAYVLGAVLRVGGVDPARDVDQAVGLAKGLSFAASLLALPVIYLFGRRRFDAEIGLGAMALLAVLPVHAIYAAFTIRESLVALAALLAVWTLTEVWSSPTARGAWVWAIVAGLCGGLAVLGRNTAMALLGGAWLLGLLTHGRRRLGPLLIWVALVAAIVAPWAWATLREYGQPFYSYTNYFQYNFSWTVHHYEKGNTEPGQFYTRANAPEIARVKVKSVAIILVTSTMILSLPLVLAVARRVWRGGRPTDSWRSSRRCSWPPRWPTSPT